MFNVDYFEVTQIGLICISAGKCFSGFKEQQISFPAFREISLKSGTFLPKGQNRREI